MAESRGGAGASRKSQPSEQDSSVKRALDEISGLSCEGTPYAVIKLIQYFGHPEWCVRKSASDGLARFDEKILFPSLVSQIDNSLNSYKTSSTEDTLYWCIRTFGAFGEGAARQLLKLLGKPMLTESYRIFVIRSLENCRSEEVAAELIKYLGSDSWAVRRETSAALTKIGEAAVPALKKAFTGGSEAVKYWAVKSLGGILGKSAIAYFSKMLGSERQSLRYFAAAALGEIDDAESLEILGGALSDPSWQIRIQVYEIFERKGKAALPVLKSVLRAGSNDAKLLSIKLMSRLTDMDVVNYILKIAEKGDTELKLFALSSIADTQNPAYIALLVKKFADPEWVVRKHTSILIEKFSDRAVAPLAAILKNSTDEELRYWAIVTLCNIGLPAMKEIQKYYAEASKKEKIVFLQSLRRDCAAQMVETIFDSFADRNWPVRNEAFKKLCEMPEAAAETALKYMTHQNADIKYWTNQFIATNQAFVIEKFRTFFEGEFARLDAKNQTGMINLALEFDDPALVSVIVERALRASDSNLLYKLQSAAHFKPLLLTAMSPDFESKPKKFKSFIFDSIVNNVSFNIDTVKSCAGHPGFSKETLARILESCEDQRVKKELEGLTAK